MSPGAALVDSDPFPLTCAFATYLAWSYRRDQLGTVSLLSVIRRMKALS
jgi:hypothetical protein